MSAPVSISDNYLLEERKERENKTKQDKKQGSFLGYVSSVGSKRRVG